MGLGIPELIVILFIIILIFGASRLPEIGRGLGKGIRNFKDATRARAERLTRYRMTRLAPARRVTRSRSRCSNNGIAYLRDRP